MQSRKNTVCFSCILDSVANLEFQENTTLPALVEHGLCSDLAHCASEKCDPACGPQWMTLNTCADKWAEKNTEEVADICDGLGKAGSAAYAPILIQGFTAQYNHTSSGLGIGYKTTTSTSM